MNEICFGLSIVNNSSVLIWTMCDHTMQYVVHLLSVIQCAIITCDCYMQSLCTITICDYYMLLHFESHKITS